MAVPAEKIATKTESNEFYAVRGGLWISKHAMTWEHGQKAALDFAGCHIATRQELTVLAYTNKQIRRKLVDECIWAGKIGLTLSGPCKWLKNGELVQLLDKPWGDLSEAQKADIREAFYNLPIDNKAWAYPGENPVTVGIDEYGGFRSTDANGFKRMDFNAYVWSPTDTAWVVLVPNNAQIAGSPKTAAGLLRTEEEQGIFLSDEEMALRAYMGAD